MIRALVTGAAGFAGQHLVAELLRQGASVVGVALESKPHLSTLSSEEGEAVTWVQADLLQRDQVRAALRAYPADRIFHLAAFSSVRKSHQDPDAAMSVNVVGTLNLLEELAALRLESESDPRVLITGSAEVYGASAARCRPLNEDCPLEPLSPYAVSKAAQEMLALTFARTNALPVIVTRSFNHTGPGQQPPFVAPELATQVARARRTSTAGSAPIRVGNPEIRRDFTDVRDVVRAYVALIEDGEPGEVYNVCSEKTYSIGELITMLAEVAGLEVELELDAERAHAVDVPEVIGDASRLRAATGWSPAIEMRKTLADLLETVNPA